MQTTSRPKSVVALVSVLCALASSVAAAAAATKSPPVPLAPRGTTWTLTGAGIRVVYVTDAAGRPTSFQYNDSQYHKMFGPQQIRVLPTTDLGTVVAVTLQILPDVGSTSFNLVLPRIRPTTQSKSSTADKVQTIAVTAVHHTGFIPLQRGQIDTFATATLNGAVMSTPIQAAG